MSFFSKFLNTLGFGSEQEEYDGTTEADAETTEQVPVIRNTDVPEVDRHVVRSIFDKVVDIVNSSLPDFLAKSVDPEKQKQYMFDALDESMKTYILSLDQAAQHRCEALWQQERQNLQTEMEKLKTQARQLEDKRSELIDRQLSADRQKRALSERVHDLEAQVLRLEAEKEQFDLENKSLLNKAKVATVLEKELEELKSNSRQATPVSAEPNPELTAQVESLTAELEKLKAENKRLTDACEVAKTKDQMEDSMVEDLRKIAAEAKAKVRDLETELEQAHKDNELTAARLDDANKKVQELEAKEAENDVTNAQIEEISAQVDRFAEVKSRLDHQIDQLKENLKKATEENQSLRETIKSNIFDHAAQEKELRQELDTLRAKLAEADATTPANGATGKTDGTASQAKRRRPVDADTSDVEDVISNTDFLSTAADEKHPHAKKGADAASAAPQQKSKSGSLEQMSLFDD